MTFNFHGLVTRKAVVGRDKVRRGDKAITMEQRLDSVKNDLIQRMKVQL